MPPVPPWDRRRAGVLLPLAALRDTATAPVTHDAVLHWLQFLNDAGFSVWQMLPIHPPDDCGSPYQSCSVHAGDPALLAPVPPGDENADEMFLRSHGHWLEDYALYAALKQLNRQRPWWEWPAPWRDRDADALASFRESRGALVESHRQAQLGFFRAWARLRRAARDAGVLLFGDLPLFPAHDSADVWARREFFQLREDGQPHVVAGVPPDAFAASGQRWGNPVYDWQALARDRFRWWVARLSTQLELFDFVRLDHFRGLEAVWEIPAEDATAEHGVWREVPGRALLGALGEAFGTLPLVAEDLGLITAPVTALRREFALPGMAVLQFAFDSDARNPYLPHNIERHAVVYTGTHDNDTTLGWFESLAPERAARVREYLGRPGEPMPWPLVRAALGSVAALAMVPAQDLLGLGRGHRTNTPGTLHGNWQWRLPAGALTGELAGKLRGMNECYGRT